MAGQFQTFLPMCLTQLDVYKVLLSVVQAETFRGATQVLKKHSKAHARLLVELCGREASSQGCTTPSAEYEYGNGG